MPNSNNRTFRINIFRLVNAMTLVLYLSHPVLSVTGTSYVTPLHNVDCDGSLTTKDVDYVQLERVLIKNFIQ